MDNRTGRHFVRMEADSAVFNTPEFQAYALREVSTALGIKVTQICDDGRAYIMEQSLINGIICGTFMNFLELSVNVRLFDATQAEVGEYVSLGSAETMLRDVQQFIHLGNGLLFEQDKHGWRRIAASEDELSELIELIGEG